MAYTFTARTAAATLCLALVCALPAQAVGVSGQGTWETTLQGRDLDGDGVVDAFYDTDLKITWLAKAGDERTWNDATTYVSNLKVGNYSDWRLPKLDNVSELGPFPITPGYDNTDYGFNVNTAHSEMAHLFHVSLGNKSYWSRNGGHQDQGVNNTGEFNNLQAWDYWIGLKTDQSPAWFFNTRWGSQGIMGFTTQNNFLAVHNGDIGVTVAAVPEPETYAMLLAGLGVIGAVARRRKTKQA